MPLLPSEKYTVGWICALPKEMAAARYMLDECHGDLKDQDTNDPNSYCLGCIGEHNIVIGCLPKGVYGTTSAAKVATNMIRTFPSIRFGLLVGIGGGVPSMKNDIRLGDVVVSTPGNGFSGVLPHDVGKRLGGDGFRVTGVSNRPPDVLLTAVASLEHRHLGEGNRILDLISTMVTKYPRLKRNGFAYDEGRLDRLYVADYEHEDSEPTCGSCKGVMLVERPAREFQDPEVHYGLMASGNQLMKDSMTRDRLGKEFGVLCFEMEAAGLMDHFPCLVIRGICDYADSHKNDVWQEFAAASAAAYAKELFSAIPRTKLVDTRTAVAALEAAGVKIVDEFKRIALIEEQRQCRQALKTSTYEQHKNVNPDRAEGTCGWALRSEQYLHWWESNCNDLLWISADPGCGKSVLAKSLIDHDMKVSGPTISICYFFFKDNDEQSNLPTALCAILHQLFERQPDLVRHAVPDWKQDGTVLQREVDKLWCILMAAISDPNFCNTICVFDALDECCGNDQYRLIRMLKSFYAQTGPSRKGWLKFLVTSRPYSEIQENFQTVTKSFPHVHLRGEEENDEIRKEISRVVIIRVAELGESLSLQSETQGLLKERLLQMEHRTYLWLHLAINDIRTTFRNSLRPDEESIRLIPSSVNAAYENILNRIPPDQVNRERAKAILQIVVGARRPLTIEEMAMALGVTTSPGSRTAAGAGLNPQGLDEKIRQLCGLFVFINDSRIYLIHQTAREFLLQKITENSSCGWYFDQNDFESRWAQICVRYLLMDDLKDNDPEGNQLKKIPNILLVYSAQHWADHILKMPSVPDSELEMLLDKLYDVTTTQFALWFPIFWEAVMPNIWERKANSLNLAALNGHKSVVERLIPTRQNGIKKLITRGGKDIDRPDGWGMPPLGWASLCGHAEVVQMLLDKGANVNARGRLGHPKATALHSASKHGYDQIAQILLKQGAKVNAQDDQKHTPLHFASGYGHDKIVHMLLKQGANVNARDYLKRTPLHTACEYGHNSIMQILLEKGAKVDTRQGDGNTALYAASTYGYDKVVQILLENGADANTQNGNHDTALYAASTHGYGNVVQILLENGADPNAQNGNHDTALQAASEIGYNRIVQILLENGADPNSQNGNHDTALHTASKNGYNKIVQMLLENGADVNAHAGYQHGTALQTASERGYDKIVWMLLENGADVNANAGYRYSTALQTASERGHDNIIQMLLENGADVNAHTGYWYGTALQTASERGHDKIVHMLLKKGADINAQGGNYGTALQAASGKGCDKIVQILLENGANVNSRSRYYGTALQAACKGDGKFVQGKGANFNATGGSDGTTRPDRYDRIVQMLLENGANVNLLPPWHREGFFERYPQPTELLHQSPEGDLNVSRHPPTVDTLAHIQPSSLQSFANDKHQLL